MTGDQADIVARLRTVLPSRWFPDQSPTLDGLLSGLGWAWSWVYQLLEYVQAQTRIATASDAWLDVIAKDFFGPQFTRRVNETDGAFRLRIKHELLRKKGTRAALVSVVQDLTGRAPLIFEPALPGDTGGWGTRGGPGYGCGYGIAGGWGNLNLPFQCFVTAFRPPASGIASVTGWADPKAPAGNGGYGAGAIQYAALSMVQGQVTDADINAAVSSVLPAATIAWVRISN